MMRCYLAVVDIAAKPASPTFVTPALDTGEQEAGLARGRPREEGRQ